MTREIRRPNPCGPLGRHCLRTYTMESGWNSAASLQPVRRYRCHWNGTDQRNLAKVGVEGSNPFARSSLFIIYQSLILFPGATLALPIGRPGGRLPQRRARHRSAAVDNHRHRHVHGHRRARSLRGAIAVEPSRTRHADRLFRDPSRDWRLLSRKRFRVACGLRQLRRCACRGWLEQRCRRVRTRSSDRLIALPARHFSSYRPARPFLAGLFASPSCH